MKHSFAILSALAASLASPLALAAPPSDHAAHERALAETTQRAALDAMFGPFVRGEAFVYRGTFAAHDNAGVQGPGFVDGDIPHAPAYAVLTFDPFGGTPAHGGYAAALAISAADGRNVEIGQNGTQTSITQVNARATSGGSPIGACDDCFPSLTGAATAPAAIDVTSLTVGEPDFFPATETHGPLPGQVTVTAALARIAPGAVVFADLVAVRDQVGWADLAAPRPVDADFAPTGGEMVDTVTGANSDPLGVLAGMLPCFLSTAYTIDRWVVAEDVARFGTRNVRLGDAFVGCAAGEGPEPGFTSMPLAVTKSVSTGVGNTATVDVVTELVDSPLLVTRSVRVAYTDTTGYLPAGGAARAVLRVHTRGSAGDVVRPFTVALGQDGDGANYAGAIALPDASTITSIELAFSDAGGRVWDSNGGRNYVVRF
jgi:hypothetical protein